MKEKKNRIIEILTAIYFIPFTVVVFLVFGVSLFTTIYYDLYQEADLPRYRNENMILLTGCVLLLCAFIILLKRKTGLITGNLRRSYTQGKCYPVSKALWIALVWAAGVSLYLILIVRGLATNDALRLDQIINAFMQGDFREVTHQGGYLFVYPFQIGYVAAGQLLYILFGASNYMVYQLLNLVAILITIWMLYEITWELFADRMICNIMAFLSMGMLFLFVYSTFVYGDIWSLAPETAALYLEIRFLKYNKVRDQIWAAVLVGCGVVLKTNSYIAVVAMVIMLLLAALRDLINMRDQKSADNGQNGKKGFAKVLTKIALAILVIVLSTGMTRIINAVYAKAIGIDEMPKGVPSTTYFAMGMQEVGGGEGGWYDGYNVDTYNRCGYDWNLTNRTAIANIKETLQDFSSRPLHAGRFYVEKLLSQWADPTCISMRELELTSRHVDGQPAIMKSIVYGKGRIIFQWVMNVFQTMIYLGTAVYCISIMKQKKLSFEQAFLILFIFGGMFFHELWEASSRYTMRYYICMLPMAACGINLLCSRIEGLINVQHK